MPQFPSSPLSRGIILLGIRALRLGWPNRREGLGSRMKLFLFGATLFGCVFLDIVPASAAIVYEPYAISTLAGVRREYGNQDGTGSSARFESPTATAMDSAGNIYTADTFGQTIRKITPDGTVSTVAGLAYHVGSTDGFGNVARFNFPWGLNIDGAGNLYIADTFNHTIRKITPDGMVSTVAGVVGVRGSNDGPVLIARFDTPQGIAVDGAGNIYVADTFNQTIRKITPSGMVTTLAGLAGSQGSTDGSGDAARFNSPFALAVDGAGNLYLAERDNYIIRKITPAGLVSTFAGSALEFGHVDGPGETARFAAPQGIAVDSAGNVYVADTYSDSIRKITPGRMVTTLAGSQEGSGTSDGDGIGSAARFAYPSGIAVDETGKIAVGDTSGPTIRVGVYSPPPPPKPIDPNNILVSIGTVVSGSGATDPNMVREFTPAGSLVQTIPFNYNNGGYPDSENLRDIVVGQDGVIAAFNGTFTPFLTHYSSTAFTFTHASFPGWSTSAGSDEGGIAAYRSFIYVTDKDTFPDSHPSGIVRFDTSNNTAIRFASGTNFSDLNIGLDGYLYALTSSHAPIRVYNPETTTLLREIPLPQDILSSGGIVSVAADQAGRLFVCGTQGAVYRLSSSGALEASKYVGAGDIDVDETGRLIVGRQDGRVLIGDSTLSSDFISFVAYSDVRASSWSVFVSFARPLPAASPPPDPTPTPTPIPTATPSPTPTPTATAPPTPTPTPAPGLVGNVATRLPVGTGDNALIQGFIVQGPVRSTKKIMVRALGPYLTQFGITDALPNPTLEIRDGNNVVVATNNDWKTTQVGGIITGNQFAEISGSGLAPNDDLESAIIANLLPGNYTAVVRGVGNTTGTGIVDAYDMSAGSPARLANIATRGFVQPGDKLMIAGFIIQNASVRAAVRAIGPSLTQFGITNALPDTTLEIRDENGGILFENDNWKTNPAQKQELESNNLQPGHDLEAALIMTIPPGQYTAQLRGKDQDSGIGVVEVYFLQ